MTNNEFATALKARTPAPEPPQPSPAAPSKKVNAKRRHIGGYFAPEVARQLRMLASEEETTVQELLAEALRLLFRNRGRSMP